MVEFLIEAYHGTGKNKVFAGKRVDQKPQTVEEATGKYGVEKFLELAYRSHVIDEQRDLRGDGNASDKKNFNIMVKLARDQKAAGDETLYNMMLDQGIKLDG